jgi:hypothetical protein
MWFLSNNKKRQYSLCKVIITLINNRCQKFGKHKQRQGFSTLVKGDFCECNGIKENKTISFDHAHNGNCCNDLSDFFIDTSNTDWKI